MLYTLRCVLISYMWIGMFFELDGYTQKATFHIASFDTSFVAMLFLRLMGGMSMYMKIKLFTFQKAAEWNVKRKATILNLSAFGLM